jgi:hypothetical protein
MLVLRVRPGRRVLLALLVPRLPLRGRKVLLVLRALRVRLDLLVRRVFRVSRVFRV